MDTLIVFGVIALAFIGKIAWDLQNQKKLQKADANAFIERETSYRNDPMLIHADAIRAYSKYLDIRRKSVADPLQSASITTIYQRHWKDFDLRGYLCRLEEVSSNWASASEAQRLLCQAIIRDKTLHRTQVEILTKTVASALEKHLIEEAEARARAAEKLRAEKEDLAQRSREGLHNPGVVHVM